MKRCVIISGADICRYDDIWGYLSPDDYNIFCDCGLRHAEPLGIKPHLIVGDFDSHPMPASETETIMLPQEKDDTDTVYAVKEALRRGFDEFLLIGAVGARFDHTFGNISVLLMLDAMDKKAMIADDYSEMEIVSRNPAYIADSFSYFSLLSIDGTACGVSIKNAKYPLDNATITGEYQYGISNEVTAGLVAEVTVGEGRLLLVRVRRDRL